MLGIQKTAELPLEDNDSNSDVPCSGRRWFKPLFSSETVQQYASYVAQYLWLLIQLLDEEQRECCKLTMPDDLIVAVNDLQNSFHEDRQSYSIDAVHGVAMALLNQNQSVMDHYNHVPICYLTLAQFINSAGDLARVDSAQKSTSAMKFWLRGTLLLRLVEAGSNANFVQTRQLIAYEIGGSHPFAQLSRLHKGICSIPRAVKASIVVGDGDIQSGTLTVDGLDLGFPVFQQLMQSTYHEYRIMLNDLMMGFIAPEIGPRRYDDPEFGQTFRSFGADFPDVNGADDMFYHILSNPELRSTIFFNTGDVKISAAMSFLHRCLQMEDVAVFWLHLLTACSSRGTDLQVLTFKDGADQSLERRVSIYNKELLIFQRLARKPSQLHGKSVDCPVTVPYVYIKQLVAYWQYVRPVAAHLARALGKSADEIDRWQR
jgi:hypothetical protein